MTIPDPTPSPIPRQSPGAAAFQAEYRRLIALRGSASRFTREDRAELSRLLKAAMFVQGAT